MLFRIVFCFIFLFPIALPVLAADSPSATTTSAPKAEEEDFPVGEEADETDAEETPKEKPALLVPAPKEAGKEIPTPLADEAADSAKAYVNTAVLQALDKITARTSLLEAPVGASTKFGTLEILVKKCWKSPPEEAPDNKALLEIWEQKPGESRIQVFSGWMLSSSPAVSALEHAVYDITVSECKNTPVKDPSKK